MHKAIFRITLIMICSFAVGYLFAQPGGGGGGQGQGGPPPGGTGGPIDDGAVLFLIAVTAYVYHINKQKIAARAEINSLQK
jgi:hypothetical protein